MDDPNAKKGGILRVAMQVQKMEDPATFDWTQRSNQVRHIIEYMVFTDPNNVTHPMLMEKLGGFRRSEDLDAASPAGREVAQRRRFQRRRRDLQLHPLDGCGRSILKRWPVHLRRDDRGGRFRREERRRHGEDGEADDRGLGRARRRPHRRASPEQGSAFGAGGYVQLSDRHRAPELQAALREQSDRHGAIRARRIRRL